MEETGEETRILFVILGRGKKRGNDITSSPIIVDETRLQGVAIEGRGDEGAGYG